MNAEDVATIVDDARENWAETPWLIDWLIQALKDTPMQPGEDKDSFISSRGLIATDDRVSSLFRGMQDGDGADEAPLAAEDEEWPIELPSPAASSPRSSPHAAGEADLPPASDDRFGSPIPELVAAPTSARRLAPNAASSTASLPSPPISTAPAPPLPTPPLTSSAESTSEPSNGLGLSAAAPPKPSSASVSGVLPSQPVPASANGRPLVPATSARPSPPASRPTSPKASMSTSVPSAAKPPAPSLPPRLPTDAPSSSSAAISSQSGPSSSSSPSSPWAKGELAALSALSPANFEAIVQPLLANTRSFVATPKSLIGQLSPRRLATPVDQRKAVLGSLHASLKRDSKFWLTWSECEGGFEILDDWLEAAIAQPDTPAAMHGEGTTELVMQTLNALPWDVPSIKKYGRLVQNIKHVRENSKGRYNTATVRHAAELLGAMDCLLDAFEGKASDKKRKNSLPTAQDPPKKLKPSSPPAAREPPRPMMSSTPSDKPASTPTFKKKTSSATTPAPDAGSPKPEAAPPPKVKTPKPDVAAPPPKPKTTLQSSVPSTAASNSSSKPASAKSTSARATSSVPTTAVTASSAARKASLSKESPAPTKPAAAPTSSGASQAFTKRPDRPELQLKFGKKPAQPPAAAVPAGAAAPSKGPSKAAPTAPGRPPVPARKNSNPTADPLNNIFERALSQRVGGGTTPPPAPAPGTSTSLKRKHSDTGVEAKPKKKVSFAPDETLENTRYFAWLSPEPEDRENVHPRPSGHHHDLHSLDTGEGGAYKAAQDLKEGSALIKTFGADLDESDWYSPLALDIPPGMPYEGELVALDRERESRIPPASYFTQADVPPNPAETDVTVVTDTAETARFVVNRKEEPHAPEPAVPFLPPGVYNPNIANALDEEQLRQLVASTSVAVPPPAPGAHQQPMPPPPPAHPFYQPSPPAVPPPTQLPYHPVGSSGGYSPHAPSYGQHQQQQQYHQSPPHAPFGGSPAHQPYGASGPAYGGQHQPRPPQGHVYAYQAPAHATPWASQPQPSNDFGLVDPDPGPSYSNYPPVHSGFQPPPPTYPDRPTFGDPYRSSYRGGGRGGFTPRGRGRGRGWH